MSNAIAATRPRIIIMERGAATTPNILKRANVGVLFIAQMLNG